MNNLTLTLIDLVEHASLGRRVIVTVRVEGQHGMKIESKLDKGAMIGAHDAAKRIVSITDTLGRVGMVPHFTLTYNW